MFTFEDILLLIAALLTALIAGLFYGFYCAVNPGLHNVPDNAYVAAMQSINRKIQNLSFFISFFGPLILLPYCTWLHYSVDTSPTFWFLFIASLCYIIGVVGITAAVHIPLNNTLDTLNIQGLSREELASRRSTYALRWNRWHVVRTASAVIAFVFILIAIFTKV